MTPCVDFAWKSGAGSLIRGILVSADNWLILLLQKICNGWELWLELWLACHFAYDQRRRSGYAQRERQVRNREITNLLRAAARLRHQNARRIGVQARIDQFLRCPAVIWSRHVHGERCALSACAGRGEEGAFCAAGMRGGQDQRGGCPAIGEGYTSGGRCSGRSRDSGNDFKGHTGASQRLDFLTQAAEDGRIARLEPHHIAAIFCVPDH